MIIIFSYLSWIILDSWKSNTRVNHCVQIVLVDSQSFAIFILRAYVEHVDKIISCKFSSFSIHDATFQNTFPPPHALRPNTYNNYFEANLTNIGFGNGGHYCETIINSSHSHWALAQMWPATFWSFYFYMTMTFPKMQMFILTWSWCWGFLLEVEGLSSLAFFAIKPCTSFKCLVNNHLATYAIV